MRVFFIFLFVFRLACCQQPQSFSDPPVFLGTHLSAAVGTDFESRLVGGKEELPF